MFSKPARGPLSILSPLSAIWLPTTVVSNGMEPGSRVNVVASGVTHRRRLEKLPCDRGFGRAERGSQGEIAGIAGSTRGERCIVA